MPLLTRTTSSVPLSSSPAKSHRGLNDTKRHSLSTDPCDSNLTKVLKSLHKRSNTLHTISKPSFPSFPSLRPSSPQREVSRWPFQHSPVRFTTPTPTAPDLGDHFARMRPVPITTHTDARRRTEAGRKRVQKMREWLTVVDIPDVQAVKAVGRPERSHQRYDSGSHEHSEDGTFYELKKLHAPEPLSTEEITSGSFETDILSFYLFRLRNGTFRKFNCVGCGETHVDSLWEGKRVVWLLHGCRHVVHDRCLKQLRDGKSSERLGDCDRCRQLEGNLKKLSRAQFESSHRYLSDSSQHVSNI